LTIAALAAIVLPPAPELALGVDGAGMILAGCEADKGLLGRNRAQSISVRVVLGVKAKLPLLIIPRAPKLILGINGATMGLSHGHLAPTSFVHQAQGPSLEGLDLNAKLAPIVFAPAPQVLLLVDGTLVLLGLGQALPWSPKPQRVGGEARLGAGMTELIILIVSPAAKYPIPLNAAKELNHRFFGMPYCEKVNSIGNSLPSTMRLNERGKTKIFRRTVPQLTR
jgi:hypothetical protein